MTKQIIASGKEATDKILLGASKLAELVGSTVGPNGKNVIIQRKYKSPIITNDGVTVARFTQLDDEIEDLGAQVLVEACMKTNEQAGDGTTSTAIMANQIVKDALERKPIDITQTEGNVMDTFRAIQKEKAEVVKIIKKQAQKTSQKDIENIITTSLENAEFGKIIAQMIEDVGESGYISVEDNWATQYGMSTETIKGMKFLGTYVSPYMVTNGKKEAIWEDTFVLVTNHHIHSINQLTELTKAIATKGKKQLVVLAEKFEKEVIEQLNAYIKQEYALRSQGKAVDTFKVLAVKTPALTSEEFEDVAVFLDAKFIDKNASLKLEDTRTEDLGFVKKIVVNTDEVILTEGRGKVGERLTILKEQLETERDPMFKEKLLRRIASLSSGVGIIRVGAMTEQERTYWKYKIEDAVYAAQAAREEGYVKGGGLCYAEIADMLGKDAVLYNALKSVNEKIKENAGGTITISSKVIDPAKVARLVVENACSAAGTLITCGGAISEERPDIWKKLFREIQQAMDKTETEDFRHYSENRGKGSYAMND